MTADRSRKIDCPPDKVEQAFANWPRFTNLMLKTRSWLKHIYTVLQYNNFT